MKWSKDLMKIIEKQTDHIMMSGTHYIEGDIYMSKQEEVNDAAHEEALEEDLARFHERQRRLGMILISQQFMLRMLGFQEDLNVVAVAHDFNMDMWKVKIQDDRLPILTEGAEYPHLICFVREEEGKFIIEVEWPKNK